MGNLLKEMKEAVKKSGSSKKEILYFAADSQKRIRFLQELDEGFSMNFHSDYNAGIYEVCSGEDDCELCANNVPIITNYIWSVWDYDSNAVRLFVFKASGVSPIPSLIEMFEEFGTICDRDYKIKKSGKGTGSSFIVTPLDKSRFRGDGKPFSEKEATEIITNAFSSEKKNDDDSDEKETKKKSKGKKKKSLRSRYEELTMDELKEICMDIGISKKEFKNFEDEDEVIEELFDNYEEDDLEELIDELSDDNDE